MTAPDPPYVPAVLPGGDVPLGRALAFLQLCQEVTQQAMTAAIDRAASGQAAADRAAPDQGAAGQGAGPGAHLRASVSDHVAALDAGPALSGFALFEAVVRGTDAAGSPWAPRFAEVIVWAVDASAPATAQAPAGHRPVTAAEASGPAFPAGAFSRAWPSFFSASVGLTNGLLALPSASESSSAGATTTTTPA